jgi:hypothetical protein
VQYQTSDGSATLANNDYQSGSGTLTIPAKDPSGTITVVVQGDECGEANETLTITLSTPTGAVFGNDTAIGTIQNDDDATAPTVTVNAPNGGESLNIGSNTNIQWSANDNQSVTSVDILLSRDGGATYPEVLASGIGNSGSFAWVVSGPSVPGNNAFVRIDAHDGGCNIGTDTSNSGFTIVDPNTAVADNGPVRDFALGSIHPNPTRNAASIEYQLPKEAPVRLTVVDVKGREIAPLVDRTMSAGRHSATWDGMTANGPAAKGVYFIQYEAGGRRLTGRLVLSR